MAISDFETTSTASIVLASELSNQLNQKQIEQILHKMLQDKISEKDAGTPLYHQLFNSK